MEEENYYKKELLKINRYGSCKIKLLGEGQENETKWLDINQESAEVIIQFLQEKYNLYV